MTIINAHIANSLEWTILKGLSNDVEDFSRSKVMLFAISETNKIPLLITSQDDGCIVATIPEDFEIPTGLTAQTYDTELIWIKNGRDVNRTYQYNVFKVDTNSTALTQTVKIKSTALVYGYDGLSAYEIAMMKAERPKSENEWLRDLLAEKANTADLNALRYRVDNVEEVLPELEEDIANLEADVSNLNNSKADKDDVYTKQLVDDNFATKTSVYTTSEVDSALELKANKTALETAEYRISEAETDIEFLLHRMDDAEADIDHIEAIIPSLASSSNQLADKEFVNSSISTNTATFRGTYNLVTDLELAINASRATIANNIPNVVSSADNNDYVFVLIPISDEEPANIAKVERYKFNDTTWAFEYELNNSGFTAAQWAAVNSGITDIHVQKVNGLDAALAAKQDVLTFDSAPTANSFNPVTSNGLYIALQNILSTSGGTINGTLTMHGNIDILMDALHSWNSIKTTTGRNLFCFKNGFNGYMIGDESIKLGIQTGSNNDVPTPIYHRITINGTAVDYPILDTYNLPANVKTINNVSVAGAGNIDIDDTFKVIYNNTSFTSAHLAYNDGKLIYAVVNENEFSEVYYLYGIVFPDESSTPTFCFYNYNAEENTVRWFEFDSERYGEIAQYGLTPMNYFLYENLSDKPSIAGVTLSGNKSLSDLGIEASSNKVTSLSSASTDTQYPSAKIVYDKLSEKQDNLVSGTNIKTINNNSILGSGNVSILPEIINLTDGTHASGYYEDLMRSESIVKKDVPLIFFYTYYNANNDMTTAICYSTYSDINSQSATAGFKQHLILGKAEYVRMLSNTASSGSYPVSSAWVAVIDVTLTNLDNKLSLSGGTMTGNINLADHELQVRSNRNGIKFSDNSTGVLVGNGSMNTTILSSDEDLKHRKGSTDYSIIDASNIGSYTNNFITNSVNNLTNYYLKTDTYTQTEVNNLIAAINQFRYEIAASTSAIVDPQSNVLYLVGPTGTGSDKYEEYIYPNSTTGFVKIGDTSIDLSGYALTANLATVATSGSYEDLTNKPTIPSISGLEEAANKTNDIASNASNTTKYPSCKGIVDYVGAQRFIITAGYNPEDVPTIDKTISEINTAWTAGKAVRLKFSYANSGIYFEEDVTKLQTVQNDTTTTTFVTHAVKSGTHYIVTIYEEDNTTKFSFETVLDSSKQDTISDLSTIRSGAAAGATAVQPATLNSYLALAGGTMTGDITMTIDANNNNKIKLKSDRDFLKFDSDFNGYVVGDGHIKLALETGNVDLVHKYVNNNTSTNYTVLDTRNLSSNIKTINGTSLVGSGDITTEVTTNKETSISASADNSHYPTSKAVYDYITTLLGYKENTIADLSAIRSGAEAGATAYQKPTTGIPSTDMTSEVQTLLGKADTAYQLPTNGIPSTDLASAIQTSLGKADTSVQPGDLNSYLLKSGGDMTGNINLNTQSNGKQLLAKSERPIISWETGNHQGNVIGNPNTRLILSSDNIDDGLLHKRNGNYYTIIDSNNLSSNIKTINGSSIVGTSGDVLLYTVSDVKTNLENLLDAFVSAGVISNYTITDPASGSKEFGFSFNNTPVAAEE